MPLELPRAPEPTPESERPLGRDSNRAPSHLRRPKARRAQKFEVESKQQEGKLLDEIEHRMEEAGAEDPKFKERFSTNIDDEEFDHYLASLLNDFRAFAEGAPSTRPLMYDLNTLYSRCTPESRGRMIDAVLNENAHWEEHEVRVVFDGRWFSFANGAWGPPEIPRDSQPGDMPVMEL